jgi:preprotein translocase subunit SecG
MLVNLLYFLHFLITVGLIVVVLMQADKGSGLSGAFGGGASQTIFGSTGGIDFIGKITTTLAILFMITSLGLCIVLTQPSETGKTNVRSNTRAADHVPSVD